MNYRKAYNWIRKYECNGMYCVPVGDPCMESCQWVPVLRALKKQIPMKPVKTETPGIRYTDSYRCPSCNGSFTGTGIADYCYHCGQKLDWGDQDD